jgi:hypothetical protein
VIGEVPLSPLVRRPRVFKSPERPKPKAPRPLTVGEVRQWYVQLSACIDRRRLLIARNPAIPRSSRRLLNARAYSAYVMRAAAWWHGMNERQRLDALRAADSICPAEAFAHYTSHKHEENSHG